jgi:hypothetical protein
MRDSSRVFRLNHHASRTKAMFSFDLAPARIVARQAQLLTLR